jgi:hypothetical protein
VTDVPARPPPRVLVAGVNDLRDRLLHERISALLVPKEAQVLPPMEEGSFARSLAPATERSLEAMQTLIALYSPEAARGWSVNAVLHRGSRARVPGCLLLFPDVNLPGWGARDVTIIPMEGFKDSGPALPPGTDERQILQSSQFAGRTLSLLIGYVRAVRAGERPPLPDVPFPPVPRFAARLGV